MSSSEFFDSDVESTTSSAPSESPEQLLKQKQERERLRKKNLAEKKRKFNEFVKQCKEKSAEKDDMDAVLAAVGKVATSFVNERLLEGGDSSLKFHKHAKGMLNALMPLLFQSMVDRVVAAVQNKDRFGDAERTSRARPVVDADAVFNGSMCALRSEMKNGKTSWLDKARTDLLTTTGFFRKKKVDDGAPQPAPKRARKAA
jgi:hypothetical protein